MPSVTTNRQSFREQSSDSGGRLATHLIPITRRLEGLRNDDLEGSLLDLLRNSFALYNLRYASPLRKILGERCGPYLFPLAVSKADPCLGGCEPLRCFRPLPVLDDQSDLTLKFMDLS